MRNSYYLTIALVALLLAWPLAAQEEDAPAPAETSGTGETNESSESDESGGSGESTDTEVAETADDEIDLDNPDDADLDEQTYEEDDDDFVPTQEIPSDTPIPFPSNI